MGDPKLQVNCSTKVSSNLWNTQIPKRGIIPNLWEQADNALQEKLSKSCYVPGDKIYVNIAETLPRNKGFNIHGVNLCYPEGPKIGAKLEFLVQKSGRLEMSQILYKFNKPAIAAANLSFKISASAVWEYLTTGCVSKDTAFKMAGDLTVVPYNREAVKRGIKPAIISFDTIKIVHESKIDEAGVFLQLTLPEYLKQGWGSFTLGANENNCEDKGKCALDTRKKYPGEFLSNLKDSDGNEAADDVCRNVEIGETIRRGISVWVQDEWKNDYKKFLLASGGKPVLAMAAVTNFKMDMRQSDCNWPKLKKEVDFLGKLYNSWKLLKNK